MTVEVIAHFEDMVEQLMIAKGLASPEKIVEQAIQAMYASLTDEQKTATLGHMVEDGFNSGVYPGDPIAEMLAEMHTELEQEKQATVNMQAA